MFVVLLFFINRSIIYKLTFIKIVIDKISGCFHIIINNKQMVLNSNSIIQITNIIIIYLIYKLFSIFYLFYLITSSFKLKL